jgi:von Willebrand factor type A domain
MTMRNEINAVDLAFVVDTTGSMGGLIQAAQNQMIAMLEEVTHAGDINLWLGMIEYRDHPPQDTMLYKTYPFTADMQEAQKNIRRLKVDGGGDEPEAVLDGITAACRELTWWKHSRRLIILVGDAPPHGMGSRGDAFPQGCLCGETIESVTRLAEEQRITIHALGLTNAVTEAFTTISYLTGGKFFSAQQGSQAIEQIATILKAEFTDIALDRRILDAWRANTEIPLDDLAEQAKCTRYAASSSLVRLLSRDLIEVPGAL